ncbi:hypothetical protein J6590_053179, partial [Homalodisca vitripennis]
RNSDALYANKPNSELSTAPPPCLYHGHHIASPIKTFTEIDKDVSAELRDVTVTHFIQTSQTRCRR